MMSLYNRVEAKGIRPAAYVKPHQAAGESLLPPPLERSSVGRAMACVLSEGSSPSVPMIFVAISISFSLTNIVQYEQMF